jgi:hypothetical protein
MGPLPLYLSRGTGVVNVTVAGVPAVSTPFFNYHDLIQPPIITRVSWWHRRHHLGPAVCK